MYISPLGYSITELCSSVSYGLEQTAVQFLSKSLLLQHLKVDKTKLDHRLQSL